MRHHRFAHHLLLAAVHGLLTLPNLGAHALWDMDEGVNAECAREMLEAPTWVVPTYNYQLRTAKPVLAYWLMRASFEAFGVSELSARLPAAVLGLGTVLVTYELGRRMFGPLTGLLAGVVLASCVQFSLVSHAATTDAPLVFFSTLTLTLFWVGHRSGNWWHAPAGVAAGLAVLSKGPVGVGMPVLIAVAYTVWCRDWRRFLDRRLVYGLLAMLAVAVPWVAMVSAETRGEWPRKFLLDENLARFATPQEHHDGPVYYYILALLVMATPWTCFIAGTGWYGVTEARSADPEGRRPARFLIAWFVAELVVFSAARTKLPNYITPLYPAFALLTARFLARWAAGELTPARWLMPTGVGFVAVTGVLVGAGFLAAGGAVEVPAKGMRTFPGLADWAWIGAVPVVAAGVMAWAIWTGRRPVAVVALAAAAVGLVGLVAAGPVMAVDRRKAAKPLVLESGARRPGEDVRLASLGYAADSQSVVFYAERKVTVLLNADEARAFLREVPAGTRYLFIPEPMWDEHLANRPDTPPHRVAARRYDFYRDAVVLVVVNEP